MVKGIQVLLVADITHHLCQNKQTNNNSSVKSVLMAITALASPLFSISLSALPLLWFASSSFLRLPCSLDLNCSEERGGVSLIHSFRQYLLSAWYMSGIVLGPEMQWWMKTPSLNYTDRLGRLGLVNEQEVMLPTRHAKEQVNPWLYRPNLERSRKDSQGKWESLALQVSNS